MSNPVFNERNLELMFHWIKERQSIYHKRILQKLPAPWTDDSILQENRFCNVFREYDRGSIYYVDKVLKSNISDQAKVLNTIYYRIFNKIETHELTGNLEVSINSLKKTRSILNNAFQKGYAPFTGAFMVGFSHGKYIGKTKVDTVFNTIESEIFPCLEEITKIVLTEKPETVYKRILSIYGMGEFLAYQIWVDLSYWSKTPYTDDDFTVAGPGCKSGIRFVFEDRDGMSYDECIYYLRDHQFEFFKQFNIDPKELFYEKPENKRFMGLQEFESAFCEISKYIRYLNYKGGKKNFRRRIFQEGIPKVLF